MDTVEFYFEADTPATSAITVGSYTSTSSAAEKNDLMTVRVPSSTTYTWNNSAGGAWTAATNWTP